jgi:hypothetical protein
MDAFGAGVRRDPRNGRSSSLSDLRWPVLRSRQKPRFLPAETEPMSEKRPPAVFPMNKEPASPVGMTPGGPS